MTHMLIIIWVTMMVLFVVTVLCVALILEKFPKSKITKFIHKEIITDEDLEPYENDSE